MSDRQKAPPVPSTIAHSERYSDVGNAKRGQVSLASERKPYCLLCIKASGVRVEFSRYGTRREAEQIGARLSELGCATEIEEFNAVRGSPKG